MDKQLSYMRLIDRKFDIPSESVQELIASANQNMLLHWADGILTAESLDALLY